MKKYSHCEVADSSGRKKKSTALFLFSFPSPSLVLRRVERPALFCLRVFFEVWRLCLHVALFQPSGFRYHPPLTPTCFFFFFLFFFLSFCTLTAAETLGRLWSDSNSGLWKPDWEEFEPAAGFNGKL